MRLSIIVRPHTDEDLDFQMSEVEVIFEGQPGEIAAPFREVLNEVTRPPMLMKRENPKNPEKVGKDNKAKLDVLLEQTRMNTPKDGKVKKD